MSQNLCLICCYSFQEKRSRFISEESRESFRKFCSEELKISLFKEDGSRNFKKSSSNFDLPFGDDITVCGDCLSLIVQYVQRRSIQNGREKKVLELQRAVCEALKELQEIVEDVQGHIDQLHSTVRMGDESCLNSFIDFDITECKENNPRTFREKILKLNIESARKNQVPAGRVIPIEIKVEPREMDDEIFSENLEHEESHSEFPEDFRKNVSEEEVQYEDSGPQLSEGLSGISSTGEVTVSTSSRGRKRHSNKADIVEHSDFEFDDFNDNNAINSSEEDLYEDHSKCQGRSSDKKRSAKRIKRKSKISRKNKTRSLNIGYNLKELEEKSVRTAAQWKDELMGRIVMELNNDINKESTQCPSITLQSEFSKDNGEPNNYLSQQHLSSNSFQLIDGQLKLRGVLVKIREKNRALQCTRCGKKYFEKRDVTGESTQLENLMRDHILSKHLIKPTKNPFQEMEVVTYTSTTRSKITYKLACPHKYSYTRRATNSKSGAQYFRCDYRLENCGATILYHNGVYRRMTRGWNVDGTHTIHAPDVERTNRQIEVGRAKDMFLQNSTKSIDDVCCDIINQSNGQLITPLERLKRRLLYAKYKTTGMPQEERIRRSFKCPHCDLVYKEKRGLTRHIKTRHEHSNSNPVDSKGPLMTKTKKIKRQKTDDEQQLPPPPTSIAPSNLEGPSIVFNDPSVASNFVNKCITAIIQQVGLSVSNSASIQVRSNTENLTSTSTSPAPSDLSQHENLPNNSNNTQAQSIHVPLQSRIVNVTSASTSSIFGSQHLSQNPPLSQWQQQQNPQVHLPLQGHFSTSNSNNNNNATSSNSTNQTQMHPWPWNHP